MGSAVTIFIGADEPELPIYINQCTTACCVVDPMSIDRLRGALPTFLGSDESSFLAYTLNIFRQHVSPSYSFWIENAVGRRAQELALLQERLEVILDQQIEELEDKRHFDEVHLNNAIINLPLFCSGTSFRELLNSGAGQSVLLIQDNNRSTLRKIAGRRAQYTIISPLSLAVDAVEAGVVPDVIVVKNPEQGRFLYRKEFESSCIVADLTADPVFLNNCSTVNWLTSSSFFAELGAGVEWGNAYLNDCDFALRLCFELGLSRVILSGVQDMNSDKLDETTKVEQYNRGTSEAKADALLRVIRELPKNRQKSIKRVLNSLTSKIKNEAADSSEFQTILWSSDYESLIKIMNGWNPYIWINESEKDLSLKKDKYLKSIEKVKATLAAPGKIEVEERLELIKQCCLNLQWDKEFEIRALAKSNPSLAGRLLKNKGKTSSLNLNLEGKHKVGLFIGSKRVRYECPIVEEVLGNLENRPDINLLIIPGLMDAQLQLLCHQYVPDLPIVTMVTNNDHFSNILSYIPLISLLGPQGVWIGGETDELVAAYESVLINNEINPLLIDPDPQGLRSDLLIFKNMLKAAGNNT